MRTADFGGSLGSGLRDCAGSAGGWRRGCGTARCRWPPVLLRRQAAVVIACCDGTTRAGVRDKAILLLLARLALRAGDIVALRLEDIDWRNALVRVCGKSQRQVGLPLPQDAGDAVLAYIEQARPRVAEDRVFLTARAPYRPFASSNSVTSIVIYALKRAGLEDVRPQGAYLFRHSAATHLLRSGASLEIISALLRHRSMDTSLIYAKTDRPMLLEVAMSMPWTPPLPSGMPRTGSAARFRSPRAWSRSCRLVSNSVIMSSPMPAAVRSFVPRTASRQACSPQNGTSQRSARPLVCANPRQEAAVERLVAQPGALV